MFGMDPFPTAPTGKRRNNQFQTGAGENRIQSGIETGAKVGRLIEHLVDEASHGVKPALHAAMAFLGTSAEPLGPG